MEDITPIIGTTLGLLAVLIPITGLTLRFTIKPLIDALIHAGVLKGAQAQAGQASQAELGRLERRVLELEQELARLKERTLPELAAGEAGHEEVRHLPELQRVQ